MLKVRHIGNWQFGFDANAISIYEMAQNKNSGLSGQRIVIDPVL